MGLSWSMVGVSLEYSWSIVGVAAGFEGKRRENYPCFVAP